MKEQDNIPTATLTDIDFAKAEMEIKQIFQMMCQFGAVDSERDLINDIIENMKSGIINPEQAIEQATNILYSKQGFQTHYR